MGSSRPTDYIFAELKMAMADKHSELAEALGAAMLGIENRDKELFARQSELNEAHFDLTETRCDLIRLEKKLSKQKGVLREYRAQLTEKNMELTEAQALLKKADRIKAQYWEKLKKTQILSEQYNQTDKSRENNPGPVARMKALQQKLAQANARIKSRDGTIEYLTEKLGRNQKKLSGLETELDRQKSNGNKPDQPAQKALLERMKKAEDDLAMMEGVNRILRQKLSSLGHKEDEKCETVQRLFSAKA